MASFRKQKHHLEKIYWSTISQYLVYKLRRGKGRDYIIAGVFFFFFFVEFICGSLLSI